jgi:hypothetical protein
MSQQPPPRTASRMRSLKLPMPVPARLSAAPRHSACRRPPCSSLRRKCRRPDDGAGGRKQPLHLVQRVGCHDVEAEPSTLLGISAARCRT